MSIPDDRAFVDEAYIRVLGRKCDLVSLSNCLEMLANHIPRRVLLLHLVHSEEGKNRCIHFTGIPEVIEQGSARPERSSILNRFRRALTSRAMEIAKRVLFTRFDAINYKLAFLLRALETRTDDIAAKSDQGVRMLSDRVTDLTSAVHQREQELAAQMQHGFRTVQETIERLDAEAIRVQERTERVEQRLIGALSVSETRSSGVENQLGVVEKKLAALEQELSLITSGLDLAYQTNAQQFHMLSKSYEAQRRPASMLANGVLATEVDGLILGLPAEEWRLAAFYTFRGVPDPGLAKYFQQLVKPGMVVVDVGANVGLYTLYAARLLAGRGEVHSFEPTPRTFEILKENVQVNGFLESGIIKVYNCGVTDHTGQAYLWLFARDCGHNTLFPDTDASSRITVATVSLDEKLNCERGVDVIKIDAEGAEPLILRGMKDVVSRSPKIHVLMEFAPSHLRRAGFDPMEFLDEIRSMGFHISQIDDATGALREVSCEELASSFSANLDLVLGTEAQG